MFGLCMQVSCLLASMESADPRLIRFEGLVPSHLFRLNGSRSDLFAITPCRSLRNLHNESSSYSNGSPSEGRFVRPVMGQQGPDRARHLVR